MVKQGGGTLDKIKIFSGGAGGVETKVNEWMAGEGSRFEIKSIQTCAFGTQNGDGAPVHTVITTVWYHSR
ncbi:MAG: hypothetical protein JOY77_08555 [Alphaproteobacteria bacterium]|nr:hypothetical protein [Alphaproteobacteria bacterium]